jgi:adenylate cyclase
VTWIQRGWGRKDWSFAAGLIGVGLAVALSLTSFLERSELLTQDLRFLHRGPRATHARIVIAAIADSTLKAWPEPMALWGFHHAAAITRAQQLGARWIGLDFIQHVSGGDEADRAFALALRGGNVVLSQILSSPVGPVNPIDALLYAHEQQLENLGFVEIPSEPDEAVRRQILFKQQDGSYLPSFPTALALRLRGRSPAGGAALQALAAEMGDAAKDRGFWINYVGPPGAFPTIPVERLAAGNLTEAERKQIRDAVVLIGPTFAGSNDEHRGVGGRDYPGVEINAHALATLIDRRPLRRASRVQEAAITALVGLATALAVASLPGQWGLALVVAACFGWWWGAARAFQADRLWPVAGPWLAIGLSWTGHQVARAVVESRRRHRIQRLFGRYVTPEIVDHLLRHPSHLQLGGAECEASILFVDIRGHTTAAQRRKPSAVMADLNELFCRIVPVIQWHGGLIYGYRGDGFLAVFGAPRPLENHAQSAVEAAIEAVRVTRRISAARVRDGRESVRIGCGINSGLVVCGNLGGADRAEYSVIGDTVNTAARLEELNKSPELNAEFPSEVVISRQTYDLLHSPPPVRGPFEFTIRGREGRTQVYEVMISNESTSPPTKARECE